MEALLDSFQRLTVSQQRETPKKPWSAIDVLNRTMEAFAVFVAGLSFVLGPAVSFICLVFAMTRSLPFTWGTDVVIPAFSTVLEFHVNWTLLCVYIVLTSGGRLAGQRLEWVRNLRLWHWYVRYFSLRVIGTTSLKPEKNYIMGYHPHGIISCGAFGTFATNASGFSKIFPGITPHLGTLDMNFSPFAPVSRIFLSALGLVSVCKESIRKVLRGTVGSAMVIVIGGASEVGLANPGSAVLHLKNRMGFVKMAIETGSSLVPVFAFGENEVYPTNKPPAGVQCLLNVVKKFTGLMLPWVWLNPIGWLFLSFFPGRSPITVVFGRAIDVIQQKNPDRKYIEIVKERYMRELKKLYDRHKRQFTPHSAPGEMVFQ